MKHYNKKQKVKQQVRYSKQRITSCVCMFVMLMLGLVVCVCLKENIEKKHFNISIGRRII